MTATIVAVTRPGRVERNHQVRNGSADALAVGGDEAGGNERHAADDRQHLGRLVAGRVQQADQLDQRKEGSDADEERQPRLAEQDDGQDDRHQHERA